MKNLIIVTALVLLANSCRHLETKDLFNPEEPVATVEKAADFTVRVSGDDLDRSLEPESDFLNKARQECFVLTARKILELQPLLKASLASAPFLDADFFEFKGQISPARIPFTNDLVQDFQCSLTIFPYFSLAGEIEGLEEEKTMAAGRDRVTLLLYADRPLKMPAYFVVGRGIAGQGVNLVRIFGSGRITRFVGTTEPDTVNSPVKQVLAQGVIMETNHEVLKGDLIFLTMMNMKAQELPEEADDVFDPAPLAEDEVWVRPEVREIKPAPSEMK